MTHLQLCPQHSLRPYHHPAPPLETLPLHPLQGRALAGCGPPLLPAASKGAAAAAHPRHAPRAWQAVAELQRRLCRAGHGVLLKGLLVAQLLLRWVHDRCWGAGWLVGEMGC
jgi:hypothetical protein